MIEVTAKAKYLRGSAQKARIVIDKVRGKDATEAMDLLKYMQKKAAGHVRKVLKSAIANATNNNGLDPQQLYIKKIYANEAPTYKRAIAAARGRSRMINKRNSHVTVVLGLKSEKENQEK